MYNRGMKKIGLLGLSNPISHSKTEEIQELLTKQGYEVHVSNILSQDSDDKVRAEVFNRFMKMNLDHIFDISGGDLANCTIKYLDFESYKNTKAYFYGYSDLTTILNSLYMITGKESCLLQIRNTPCICKDTFQFDYTWINSKDMSGIVVGGNIRCFLKLAQTKYFPNCKDKILFLESYSGNINRIKTYFAQLEMMGVFEQINGLILGQFTELDQANEDYILEELVKEYDFGIIRTHQIGHSKNSKALWIGRQYTFKMINSKI